LADEEKRKGTSNYECRSAGETARLGLLTPSRRSLCLNQKTKAPWKTGLAANKRDKESIRAISQHKKKKALIKKRQWVLTSPTKVSTLANGKQGPRE